MVDTTEIVDIDENRLMAALSYVGVLVFVPLLLHSGDPLVRWHVKQGLVILIGIVLALIAAAWHAPTGSALFLILIIVDIVALVQALLGKRWKIPVIGSLAEMFRI